MVPLEISPPSSDLEDEVGFDLQPATTCITLAKYGLLVFLTGAVLGGGWSVATLGYSVADTTLTSSDQSSQAAPSSPKSLPSVFSPQTELRPPPAALPPPGAAQWKEAKPDPTPNPRIVEEPMPVTGGVVAFVDIPYNRLAKGLQKDGVSTACLMPTSCQFPHERQIYLITGDGRSMVQLTDLNPGAFEPAWAPDTAWARLGGIQLAFTRLADTEQRGSLMHEIWMMSAADPNPAFLTVGRISAFSPDGARLSFTRQDEAGMQQVWFYSRCACSRCVIGVVLLL